MASIFRYVTLAEVKARISTAFLTDAGITDSDILLMIEEASAAVNDMTGQVFQPTFETEYVSARGDSTVMHPKVYPVLDLTGISMISTRTTGEFREMDRIIPGMRNFPELQRREGNLATQVGYYNVNSNSTSVGWEVGKRFIKLLSIFNGFSSGQYNIEMQGWWGWLENPKAFSTTIATEIAANTAAAVTVHVADIVDATTGQMIANGDTISIIVSSDASSNPVITEIAIVQSIAANGGGGFDLTVDTLHEYPIAIPVGAVVKAFGRVPVALSNVIRHLALSDIRAAAASMDGDVAGMAAIAGLLESEKTDNYSYKLRSGADVGGSDGGTSGIFTGVPKLDLILKRFSRPAASVRVI